MIDLLILYDVDGWAYHGQAQALARHAPADFRARIAAIDVLPGTAQDHAATPDEVHHWETHFARRLQPADYATVVDGILGSTPSDVIFVLCHHQLPGVRRAVEDRGWPTRIIVSWNNGWPRRREAFPGLFALADAVVVNNLDYWNRSGRPPRSHAIANGVDLETFRVLRPVAARPPRVLWCGSEYHRFVKGYDQFIAPLFDRLRAEGTDCDALLVDSRAAGKRRPREMAEWYNTGTVLVCASSSEGTPNPALEAAACGCTLVTTRVGNMPELIDDGVNGIFVEQDAESLYRGVRRALADHDRLSGRLLDDIANWGWERHSERMYRVFRDCLAVDRPHRPAMPSTTAGPAPDLSAEMTVFVSTVGAASFDDCMAHLHRQDCRFRLEVISRVAPMSAAFQRMLDTCETPYYIQVDEDMLLRPDAVRLLHGLIRDADPDVAFVCAWLWDVHLRRGIQGVKAYRHAIVRDYPYVNVESCEKDQLRRLQADGFRYLRPLDPDPTEHGPWTLGRHGAHYDPQVIFERYSTLEHHMCEYPDKLAWFAAHGADFLARFRNDPSELNLMALMGILAGRLAGTTQRGEKDYRTYDALPGWREARAFFLGITADSPRGEAGCAGNEAAPAERSTENAGGERGTPGAPRVVRLP